MRVLVNVAVVLVFHSSLLLTGAAHAELRQYAPENVYNLWDGEAPGTPATWTEPEFRGQHSISNVTRPTLTIVRPRPEAKNGTAMIVAPGGSFTGLAWNLEGAEVADWLAGLPAELHVYEKGGHGFGTRRHDLPVGAWTSAFEAWARDHGYLPGPS